MELLNLSCAEGLRSVPLSAVQRLRFLESERRERIAASPGSRRRRPRQLEEDPFTSASRAKASAKSASATSSRIRSGRRAIASSRARTANGGCRRGPTSRTPATTTGTTSSSRWCRAGQSRSRWTCIRRCSSRGRRSSRRSSRRCGRRPTAGRSRTRRSIVAELRHQGGAGSWRRDNSRRPGPGGISIRTKLGQPGNFNPGGSRTALARKSRRAVRQQGGQQVQLVQQHATQNSANVDNNCASGCVTCERNAGSAQ